MCEAKLKPCPFCGSSDVILNRGGKTLNHRAEECRTVYVICNDCEAKSSWQFDDEENRKFVIASWNRRVKTTEEAIQEFSDEIDRNTFSIDQPSHGSGNDG